MTGYTTMSISKFHKITTYSYQTEMYTYSFAGRDMFMRYFGGGVGHSYRATFKMHQHQNDVLSGDLPQTNPASFQDELQLRDNELGEGGESENEQDDADERGFSSEDSDEELYEGDAEDGEGQGHGEEGIYGMAPL